jgi:glycosyltransferase involved in cell wall biosynthesis
LRREIRVPGVTSFFARSDTELAWAYRAAEVTVVPSLAECSPFVVLESFAAATPVVAFRVGGLPELVGAEERGLLAESYDVGQLGQKLRELLENSGRADELGRAAQAWVNEHCRMDAVLRRLVGVYRDTLADWQGGQPAP